MTIKLGMPKFSDFVNAEDKAYKEIYKKRLEKEAKEEAEKRFLREHYPKEYQKLQGEKKEERRKEEKERIKHITSSFSGVSGSLDVKQTRKALKGFRIRW